MEEFLSNLKRSNFTSTEIDQVMKMGKITHYKKGVIFSKSGSKCQKIGILQKGIFGGYQMTEDNEKRLMQFYFLPHNYVVADYKCLVQECNCEQTIIALEDSTVLEVDIVTAEKLRIDFPNFMLFDKNLAQQKYLESLALINMFQTANAQQKIAIIKEKAPELLAKVPYSYIASFLGLHRNTFAEAMKKM